ncbi:plasmid mobilization relaxosome protein MobC [Aureimonas altamirensis]|uniref:plasmid mobilization relaxosome protein MobC n=1 Tax=Aureimonas altamirensis TaxID=370622 RepID=UPI00255294F5|nr:plasmid mobilization relaxosome protein MobC [Aureimonas altamirensis]
MKHVSTHIDDALAVRFAAVAKAHGGKSALLRRLVSMAVDGPSGGEAPAMPQAEGRAMHLSVRLSENEVVEVRKAAATRGMKPAQWLRSVIRVRLGGGTQYTANELHQLRALTMQVRKVGVNLNQIARSVNEARMEHAPFSVDAKALDAARAEVERTLSALHTMAQGNVRSWEGADGE